MSDGHLLKLHAVNGSYCTLFFAPSASVNKVIESAISKFTGYEGDPRWFALGIVQTESSRAIPYSKWLHSSLTVGQANQHFVSLGGLENRAKLELKIRFLPKDLDALLSDGRKPIFNYLYDQVRRDYLNHVAQDLPHDKAILMACYLLHNNLQNLTPSLLEKNVQNFEELGFARFFPPKILTLFAQKPYRKQLLSVFKEVYKQPENKCALQFFNLLCEFARYDTEIFGALLLDSNAVHPQAGVSQSVPARNVQLYIGPLHEGISYLFADSVRGSADPTQLNSLVKFADVTQCEVMSSSSSDSSNPSLLCIGTQTSRFYLEFAVPEVACSLAHLLDGYCNISALDYGSVAGRRIWLNPYAGLKGQDAFLIDSTGENIADLSLSPNRISTRSSDAAKPTYADSLTDTGIDDEDDCEDYAPLADTNLKILRDCIELQDYLGKGQFGEVYRAFLKRDPSTETEEVAVKTSHLNSEDTEAGTLIEEAHTLQLFHHEHIIKLVGVCSDFPVWLVMEYAPFGELKKYLLDDRDCLIVRSQLVDFCHQISKALSYLASRFFVHRDIAARNILVTSNTCVKLSDFGLGRQMDEHSSVYTANTKGKLPIKWMAPESINFRKFNIRSDVWMFGVCIWEILSRGSKPFRGVRNIDVIERLERGDRLPVPIDCPMRLYHLMDTMWCYEPRKRPAMEEVRFQLREILKEELQMGNLSSRSSNLFQNDLALAVPPKPPGPIPLRVKDRHSPSPSTEHRVSQLERIEILKKTQLEESEQDSEWLESAMEGLPHSPVTLAPGFPATSKASIEAPSTPTTVERKRIADRALLEQRTTEQKYQLEKLTIRLAHGVSRLMKGQSQDSVNAMLGDVRSIIETCREILVEAQKLQELVTDKHDRDIEMGKQVLSNDLNELVNCFKSYVGYAETTVAHEYRKQVLTQAHTLVHDTRNFYETVSSAHFLEENGEKN